MKDFCCVPSGRGRTYIATTSDILLLFSPCFPIALLSIYRILLGKLPQVSLCPSCIQYIVSVSNSPTTLPSLCLWNFNCLWLLSISFHSVSILLKTSSLLTFSVDIPGIILQKHCCVFYSQAYWQRWFILFRNESVETKWSHSIFDYRSPNMFSMVLTIRETPLFLSCNFSK